MSMPQDPNQGFGNTPPPQQPPYGGPPRQDPYGPTSYGPPPQQPPYGSTGYGTPPQQPPYGPPPGYGAPPPGFEPAFSGPAGYQAPLAPLPLGEAIKQLPNQYIKVLTKLSVTTFNEELRKSSWDITVVQLAIMTTAAIIISLISALFVLASPTVNMAMSSAGVSSNMAQAMVALISATSIGGAFLNILFIPLSFFIGVGIQFLLAKAFKGEGTFLTQSYSVLLYQVPTAIIYYIISFLRFIPIAGIWIVDLVALATWIYQVVLNVFQIMAVHRLSGGKATAVVLIPFAVAIFFLLLCGLAFGALFVSAMHNMYR
jgi:Yip1 domain